MRKDIRQFILIVVDEVGFVMWLGSKLHKAGYQVLPAKRPGNAARLLARYDRVPDLLVIDLSLRGAVRFANELSEERSKMKVLALTYDGNRANQKLSRMDGTVTRPENFLDAVSVLRKIHRTLVRHMTA